MEVTKVRRGSVFRKTKETEIQASVVLDGEGKAEAETGVGFFDHMLAALAAHGGFDIEARCVGDLHVDCHHTVEDVGIALGTAFAEATADKSGIARYGGFTVPMDEALASCHVDLCGRAAFVFNGGFDAPTIGAMDSQMVKEFFKAFAMNAKLALHVNIHYGENDHHKCEAAFKAFAHALKAAVRLEAAGEGRTLSTKGVL
ncbi:MAG: imidazoleglycerol-phosphate dehydratase HisB [Clostridiales Family XIII bacterium]|jgi:imidazoleglycerol-phosphate dehydratase|nr:imidazoleglycerol-phosphate dehydratase HisB [Clostridiales Family XIII bacterium]